MRVRVRSGGSELQIDESPVVQTRGIVEAPRKAESANVRISPDSAFRVSLSAAGARGRGGVDRVTKTLNCTSGPVNSGYGWEAAWAFESNV